jgi:hypothetical protein
MSPRVGDGCVPRGGGTPPRPGEVGGGLVGGGGEGAGGFCANTTGLKSSVAKIISRNLRGRVCTKLFRGREA